MKAAFVSVVPSPYQRDLFQALAKRSEVELQVFYLEAGVPETAWPEKPLATYEKILRGFWFRAGSGRSHVNWPLPNLRAFDIVVMNTLMSVTAQWLIRTSLRKRPWLFWGERLSHGGRLHERLAAPLHRSAGIAAIGSFAEEDYRARFPEPRHFCIPYFCDLEPFLNAPRRARDDGHVVFLFCGQMIARKGVDVLLAAFQRIGAAARLLLVGPEADLPQFLAPLPAPRSANASSTPVSSRRRICRAFSRKRMFSSCPAATMAGVSSSTRRSAPVCRSFAPTWWAPGANSWRRKSTACTFPPAIPPPSRRKCSAF